MVEPSFEAVRDAAGRIAVLAHRTPVHTSSFFDGLVGGGARVFFKCENLQRVGAFKIRGATNAILSLPEAEARRGVVTHSSGNHAQAVALAAAHRGVPAYVVMPRTAPPNKRAATEDYGAEVVPCEPTLEARERTAAGVVERTGATFVHPYDDPRVIAGQGTAALELIEEVGPLDVVVTPCGGGGLLSGTSIAVAGASPEAEVWGAEPAGADDARRSLEQGRIIPSIAPRTVCDALLTSLGELTFAIVSRRVARIVAVDDEATIRAMRQVWERMKLVIEVSSAVPVAAVVQEAPRLAGKRVGVILSGGNADLGRLPW
jgi:threonine dehydratase/serine racemase